MRVVTVYQDLSSLCQVLLGLSIYIDAWSGDMWISLRFTSSTLPADHVTIIPTDEWHACRVSSVLYTCTYGVSEIAI